MVHGEATTVEAYLNELPEERRAVMAAVREVILRNLPEGYCETVNWGMLSYEIPLERYPNTYNRQPLMYLGLAAQKKHYALYAHSAYANAQQRAWLEEAFRMAGKKLDMGKSCLRFRRLEDLPLDVIAQFVASTPVDGYIRFYESVKDRG